MEMRGVDTHGGVPDMAHVAKLGKVGDLALVVRVPAARWAARVRAAAWLALGRAAWRHMALLLRGLSCTCP